MENGHGHGLRIHLLQDIMQFIKMLEKIGQVIKQASMDELNNQLSQVEVLGTYTMQGT